MSHNLPFYKFRLILTALTLMLLSSTVTVADHLYGGDITWQALPNGQYIFTLKLYSDCRGTNLNPFPKGIVNNAGVTIVCQFVGVTYLNDDCNAQPCDSTTPGYWGAIEEHIYKSGPIPLNGSPPPGGWCFIWSNCCRASTTNIASLGGGTNISVRAFMFPYTPSGANSPVSLSTGYNSSPTFLPLPDLTFCAGQPEVFPNYAVDVDGDSLYYEFAPPAMNACFGTFLNYASGYNYLNPLGSLANTILNGVNGDLSFNTSVQGAFTVCIKVEEWRCGQLIGYLLREVPVIVKSCPQAVGPCVNQGNNPPTTQFQWLPGYDTLTPVLGSSTTPDYYEMTVAPNTPIKFKVNALDADVLPSCAPQTISLKAYSPFLASSPQYSNATQCQPGQNCATLTSLNTNGTFASPITNSFEFNWTPACQPAGLLPYACQNQQEPHWFWFEFVDNACPMPKSRRILVRIVVDRLITKPTITAQLSSICTGDSTLLTAPPNFANYTWSTGATGNAIWAKPGTYWVVTSDTTACLSADTVTISAITPYTTTPQICRVTYADSTGYAHVFWEKPSGKGTMAYRVYKAALQTYTLLAEVSQNTPGYLIDSAALPSSRYYLTLLDSCGHEYGAMVDHHRTIKLSGNPTYSGVQLSWNAYEGAIPNNYVIYRKDNVNAPFLKYDSVTAQTLNYLDQQLPGSSTVSYWVSATFDSVCDTTLNSIHTASFSNQLTLNNLILSQFSLSSISVLPNPTSGILELSEPLLGMYKVLATDGRLIKSGEIQGQRLDISDLPQGLYILALPLTPIGCDAQFKVVKID